MNQAKKALRTAAWLFVGGALLSVGAEFDSAFIAASGLLVLTICISKAAYHLTAFWKELSSEVPHARAVGVLGFISLYAGFMGAGGFFSQAKLILGLGLGLHDSVLWWNLLLVPLFAASAILLVVSPFAAVMTVAIPVSRLVKERGITGSIFRRLFLELSMMLAVTALGVSLVLLGLISDRFGFDADIAFAFRWGFAPCGVAMIIGALIGIRIIVWDKLGNLADTFTARKLKALSLTVAIGGGMLLLSVAEFDRPFSFWRGVYALSLYLTGGMMLASAGVCALIALITGAFRTWRRRFG